MRLSTKSACGRWVRRNATVGPVELSDAEKRRILEKYGAARGADLMGLDRRELARLTDGGGAPAGAGQGGERRRRASGSDEPVLSRVFFHFKPWAIGWGLLLLSGGFALMVSAPWPLVLGLLAFFVLWFFAPALLMAWAYFTTPIPRRRR